MAVLLHGCIAAWLHCCMTVLLHGCIAAWLHFCMAALLHDCIAAWLYCCTAVFCCSEPMWWKLWSYTTCNYTGLLIPLHLVNFAGQFLICI
jgi:hypothetical protein